MRAYRYEELSIEDLKVVDPEKTFCLMAVSPMEAHGPHLPLGTDVLVGEKLQREYCLALEERYPGFSLLILPSVYAGCDALPYKGSINIRAKTLEGLLKDYVRSIAEQGFRYLIICDNHGGPSHQMAMEAVSRWAWRKYRFFFINPFNVVFRKMVLHDRSFLDLVNLSPGICGDDSDCHAGTNETSLMLAAGNNLVKNYETVPDSLPPKRGGFPALVGSLGKILGRLGLNRTGEEIDHLANLLAWTGSPGLLPYLGSPRLASSEAGERMIRGHVAVMTELLSEALSGQKPDTTPMLWSVRFLRR
ncbi:MAG: creatininase family protein [Bacillota bacterium]